MKILGVIPARYASSRFPGKPLIDIGGKTMIQRVYEQAMKATQLSGVVVATDDNRIKEEVLRFSGKVMMTAHTHLNGTERCAEVAEHFDCDAIINIQGDEPFIHPEQIDLLAACFTKPATQIATLVIPQTDTEGFDNPNRIKVVLNKELEALYFSRSAIPYPRTVTQSQSWYQHIGIYGYRKDVLLQLVKLVPSNLELTESLEQLRWLENGYRIQCAFTSHQSHSVDTPEDAEKIKSLLSL